VSSADGLRMSCHHVTSARFIRDRAVEYGFPATEDSYCEIHSFLLASDVFLGWEVVEIPISRQSSGDVSTVYPGYVPGRTMSSRSDVCSYLRLRRYLSIRWIV
jgi:hypothetical protein